MVIKKKSYFLFLFSSPAHLILYFDFKSKEFKLKSVESFYLNENHISESSEAVCIKSFDRIAIDCELCYGPHIYVMIFPKTSRDEELDGIDMRMNLGYTIFPQDTSLIIKTEDDKQNITKRLPDLVLANKWTSHEKDCLRKLILIYGYGRWRLLKQNSGGVLSDKPENEIKIFSNAFIKTIVELLPQEKSELRKFLINLIDEATDEPYILAKKDDWGTLIKQRAPAWGKRIQLLYRVCLIIEKFKSERKKNKEKRKKLDELTSQGNGESDEAENIKADINKTYDYWDNLLNFLPNHAFYGQRPSIWWTRTHDIDLLRGTYKFGYANYQMMRSDPKLSFSKLEKDTSFQEFPNADTITRRLKKLIQIIIKSESNNGIISFEDRKNIKEPTGFTLEEKNKIVQYLIDQGVPLNSEGKSDWALLKDQLTTAISLDSSKTAQMIERLVQRLRMISQLVIQLNDNSNNDDASVDENMLEQMDPDNDGFNILFEEAEKLNKNMNILHFIRKYILADSSRLFNNGLNTLIEATNSSNTLPQNLPTNWDCSLHDKNLLIAVEENGFSFLNNLSGNSNYGFEEIVISYDDAVSRINFLCEFLRDFSTGHKTKKKRDNMITLSNIIQSSEPQPTTKRKTSRLTIQRDEEGNIIYPLIINSSLQILNLGKIENEKSAYHTEKNLFPVGYKAIREHASMNKLGERALYTCEILDGGTKPLYKLTPHEDEENPILKESSTGCWVI